MNTEKEEPKTRVLRIADDLVSTNAGAVRSQFEAQIAPEGWRVFQLDLSGARIVDSVGLNLIVMMLKRARKQGARMQILYSSRNILRTFIFTRLDRHIEMVKV